MSRLRVLGLAAAGVVMLTATVAAEPVDCVREPTLKSEPGGSLSELTFENKRSEGPRRVYWLDETGRRNLKAVVEAGKTHREPTIVAHYWVVTDAAEKCLQIVTAPASATTVQIGSTEGAVPAAPQRAKPKEAPPRTAPRKPEKADKPENRDRPDKCRRGHVYSSSMKQCVPISATCTVGVEVYSAKLGRCVTKKAEPKGCEEGFKLVDGKCKKIAKKDKPQRCPPGTVPVPQTDNCVWKKDKKGFEVAPWKKPGCKGLQAACKSGNKSACGKYESTCQVN